MIFMSSEPVEALPLKRAVFSPAASHRKSSNEVSSGATTLPSAPEIAALSIICHQQLAEEEGYY